MLPRWPGRKDGESACPANTVCTNLAVTGGLVVSWVGKPFSSARSWVAGTEGRDSASLGYNCSCIENSTEVLLGNTEYLFRRGFDSRRWVNGDARPVVFRIRKQDIDECTVALEPTGRVVDPTQGANGRLVMQEPGEEEENLSPLAKTSAHGAARGLLLSERWDSVHQDHDDTRYCIR